MRIPALVLTLGFAFGCSRCDGPPAPTPDAGSAPLPTTPDAGLPPAASATDLRSALFLMYPEFRQSVATGGLVTFEEVSEGQLSADGGAPELRASLTKKGWTIDAETAPGRLTAKNHPFLLEVKLSDRKLSQRLSLPLTRTDVPAIFGSPTTPTTENLAARLGDVPGFKPTTQLFRFDLEYRASSADKASVLITYQARSLIQQGWTLLDPLEAVTNPDAGLHTLPSPATIRLVQESTGAKLNLSREGDEVTIAYLQPIRAR